MATIRLQIRLSPTASSAELIRVAPADLPAAWEVALDWIAAACRRIGLYGPSYVYDRLKSGEWVLFLAKTHRGIEGVAVAEVVAFPLASALRIWICTGRNAREWVHLLGGIEAFARNKGASRSALLARPGWKRLLKGYEATHILLEKDL